MRVRSLPTGGAAGGARAAGDRRGLNAEGPLPERQRPLIRHSTGPDKDRWSVPLLRDYLNIAFTELHVASSTGVGCTPSMMNGKPCPSRSTTGDHTSR